MKTYIEILKVTKDKKKFIVLTNNGEYKFDEETIIKHLILKGKTFSDDEFEEILKTEEISKLFNKALNYISYQMRSENEIIEYLKEKEASFNQIEIILEKIKDFGYINDLELANNLFESMIRNKKGPKVLKIKLKEKRIDEKIINEILLKYTHDIEKDVIDELLNNLKDKKTDKPIKKQRQHIYEKLIRDGFSNELVNNIISTVKLVDNSSETLEKELEKLEYKYRDCTGYERRTKIISNLLNKGYEYSDISKKIKE